VIAGFMVLLTCGILISWNWKSSLSLNDFDALYKSIDYPAQYAKTIGGYEIKVKLRPVDYHCALLAKGDHNRADSLKTSNDSIIFMDMKISGYGENSPLFEGDQEMLEQRLMYFMSFMKNDLRLEDDHGAYGLVNHHAERNYNITNSLSIQMAFKRTQDKSFTFVYDDHVLGIGTIKMKVDEKDLDRIPSLNE